MTTPRTQVQFRFGWSFTPIVKLLLWINGLVYAFLAIAPTYREPVLGLLGLIPQSVTHGRALWQPITYMFIHEHFWHFLLNMLALWWFGSEVERTMGSRRFLRYYFFTGIGGALAAIAVGWNSPAVTIGASGAIFGLLIAFGLLFPDRLIYIYFVLPVKAKWCVAAYGAITIVSLLSDTRDGVSHIAHFGGMIFGLVWFGYTRLGFDVRGWFHRVRRDRARRRFRVVRGEADSDHDVDSGPTIH